MGSEEAVFTAATARAEVRRALDRMEYHIGRGPKGLRGVKREVAFLNALGRQSARLGAKTAAGINVTAKGTLGNKALEALSAQIRGNTGSAGRLKSSLLAEYSQDTMSGSRDWTYQDSNARWTWVANASACPACLDNHGKRFTGGFVQMHPSCLCYPMDPVDAQRDGIQPLTDQQLVSALTASNNAAFASIGEAVRSGRLSIAEAAEQATRRSAKGLARWQKTLADQKARAPGLADDATFGLADVKAAEEVVLEEVRWLDTMKESGTRIKYSAKRHERILQEAQEIISRAVASPAYRAKLDEAMSTLNRFTTLSDTNKGRQTRWAGRFRHRHRSTIGRKADGTLDFSEDAARSTFREIELQMRYQNQAALDEWNALVTQYNVQNRELRDQIRLARNEVRERLRAQGNTFPKPYEIDELVDADLWGQLDELQKTKPKKGSVGLTADRPTEDIAEILLHEVTHAVDEATGFQLSARAVADGIQEEFRRLAQLEDELAPAFRYGAERGLGAGNGHETFAEVVRMYHHGTGVMTPDGVAKQGAAAWREANPTLARWVEDNVL